MSAALRRIDVLVCSTRRRESRCDDSTAETLMLATACKIVVSDPSTRCLGARPCRRSSRAPRARSYTAQRTAERPCGSTQGPPARARQVRVSPASLPSLQRSSYFACADRTRARRSRATPELRRHAWTGQRATAHPVLAQPSAFACSSCAADVYGLGMSRRTPLPAYASATSSRSYAAMTRP